MNKSKIVTRKVVPTRSKSAVNKSIRESRANTSRGGKKETGIKNKAEEERLDEIFEKNLSMAIALLPAVPIKNSPNIRKWITRLFDPQLPKSKRNSFLAFLIFQMQNMKIYDPFDQVPPQNLPDPSKIMVPAKWKTMMQEADQIFQERIKERLCLEQWGRFKKEFKSPVYFLEDQPAPTNGILYYGGCFSNHFDISRKFY